MSNKLLYTIIGIAVVVGLVAAITTRLTPVAEAPVATSTATSTNEDVVCAQDAMLCPDGTYVGRTGPNCEFECPDADDIPDDIKEHIESKADLIKVASPAAMSVVKSPLKLAGEARGNWYFEASAPVSLVNWDGLIIAEGYVTADGEWMTTEFVPFTGELCEFESPYKPGDPDFMKRGAIIFKKDNPSGLPENDDALEIPVWFSN